ncbi:hypothetical protein PRIPAC_72077 [Pristionchus pacificus]|nr:hypothetical protein PRIPAC_72077 [Pristionchus pacificus]
MSQEEEIVASLKSNLSALKFKLERQEALENLTKYDSLSLDRLTSTRAGMKIRDGMKSSRFGHTAKELQNKWIAAAQRELKARWEELKHDYLTKDQIKQLERAQNRWNIKHGLVDPSAIAKKAPPVRTENPYQKVYQRHFTAPAPLAIPSSSSSTPLHSPYGSASTAFDPDSNFVAYNYSTVSIKRPRGRPRTNFTVKGEGGRKRGRPPTKKRY